MFFVSFVSFVSFVRCAEAQALAHRGFVEAGLRLFPQEARNDPTRAVGDVLAREELFLKPSPWVQFAGGVDLRANSHDQIDDRWTLDVADRGVKRPRLSLRRLSATFARGPLTVDVGKQFVRWGKADIVTPTDRFAPRDFLNVLDGEFLAVAAVRGVALAGRETFEAVWVPRFTPSRIPLLDQRWTVLPENAPPLPVVELPRTLPSGSQTGLRWGHQGDGFEYALSFFDGFNHLPNVDGLLLTYPAIRTYGADAAVPTRWFTVKGEAAYFTRSGESAAADLSRRSGEAAEADEFVLYVLQLERQTGEWTIVAGYAGEAVTSRRSMLTFAPDRGLTRSIVGRASYTIDTQRSVAFEAAIRQNGKGVYSKVEFSQAHSAHWRATITGIVIGGDADDFLGQYRRNSHASATVRYSF